MTDPMEPDAVEQPEPVEVQDSDEILAALVNGEREGLPLYDNDSQLIWGEDPDSEIQGDIHLGDEDESGDDLAEDEVDDAWLDGSGEDDDSVDEVAVAAVDAEGESATEGEGEGQ